MTPKSMEKQPILVTKVPEGGRAFRLVFEVFWV
jgi:hypothetical protein